MPTLINIILYGIQNVQSFEIVDRGQDKRSNTFLVGR